MRRLVIYVIILIVAILAGLWLVKDPGYVMFSYRNWTLETSVWFFVIVAVIVFIILYAAINSLRGISRAPRSIRDWRNSRRSQRAHSMTSDGVLALQEGNWKEAEYFLVRGVESSAIPVVNYLCAARAAQEMLAYDRRDEYLRRALTVDKKEAVAVGLTKAQLQLEHHQLDLAKETLTTLKAKAPKHPYVQKLIFQLHVATNSWDRQLALIPDLRKSKIVDTEDLDRQELLAVRHLFQDENKRLDDINALWLGLSKAMRARDDLIHSYASALIRLGANEMASDVIIAGIKRHWSDLLATLYGDVKIDRPLRQLTTVQEWLKKQPESPALYLTAAKIAEHAENWPTAKSYAEKSLQLNRSPEAYTVLASAAEKLNEPGLVISALREGLALRCQRTQGE